MTPSEITRLSAAEIARKVRSRELGAVKAAEAFLARIRRLDGSIRAFLCTLEEQALEQARAVDERAARGEDPGRLAGVPVAIKDNLCVRGAPTTCGSKALQGHRAVYDATAVERLRAEGALLLGKTNLDEFAMGSSTENSAYFTTRNPWDLDRVPGGSSGGSAAAVAARMVPLALGSDTGGSIRQPASFCGVVGLKPAYGTVSRWGLVAYASSLDQVGPLARTVEDAALALSVIAGQDERDSTCLPSPPRDFAALSRGDIQGLKVGLPREYLSGGLDRDVEQAMTAAVAAFRELGALVCEVSLPHTAPALSAYYLLAPSEASANLARFDGMRYGRRDPAARSLVEAYEESRGAGFGPEVQRRIMLGTFALSAGYYDAYYRKAQKVRTLVRRDFDEAFERVDLLLTPTAPTPAFRAGEKSDPLQMYLSDVFTVPCNMAGVAGLSIPGGLSSAGLPIGLQLLGREEGALLRAAARFEELRPFALWPEAVEARA
ncbi:MAG TPA: Asp-tRNA(Asn)/Glu-tRNA(Gln) amidotransferase GatCAB subunit A [Elusimicrobia bacterium]|nr:Asp-tRNA(Asn)/Glu-tRNA(Gln) amidotransferase GatCAB subunit A [Elusimicrobiota bacterium]